MILLFQSWLQSLKLFYPNNFMPFLLVTIKSWFGIYKKVLIDSLLLVLYCLNSHYFDKIYSMGPVTYYLQIFFVFSFPVYLITLFVPSYAIVLRPSVDKKDSKYYVSYGIKSIILCLFICLFAFITFLASVRFSMNDYISNFLLMILIYIGLIGFICFVFFILFFLSQLVVFTSFFYLDSKTELNIIYSVINLIKSLFKAILLILYNYPFCLISSVIFCLISSALFSFNYYFIAISSVYIFFRYILYAFTFIFISSLYIAWLKNFYFKRVYDQFKVYFNK